MKNCKNELKVLTFFVVFSLFLSMFGLARNVAAKDDPATSSNGAASQEELAQILAPIALYPDSLLAQMFMAATYPLEVVEADRFVKKNGSLKEDALDKALKDKKWDVSVKSICHFPSVLASMSDNLDATKRLGDYFLENQKAVMDMVQTLRAKAKKGGNLKTTEEQKVVVEKEIIIIESANPEVVYVPAYSCTYVYGPWWYPHYPPYVWYPPPPRYGFSTGIIIGIGIGSWCRPNWGRGNIDIDINRTTNFNNNVKIGGGKGNKSWKHNSKHRQGVAYNNKSTRKKFGQSDRAAKKRDLGRGRASKGLDRKTRNSIKKQDLNRNVRRTDNRKQDRKISKRASRPSAKAKQNRFKSQRSSAFSSSGSSGRRSSKMSRRGNTSRNTSRNRGGSGRSRGGRRR
ncbi:DUF3300 domain-containing protein [bacterium]|nr:DUF3300 domain-containing protein [bacterium]